MIFLIRHGERADDSHEVSSIKYPYDPHLTKVGVQ